MELQEAHARLRQLAARLISAQEDERRKLSATPRRFRTNLGLRDYGSGIGAAGK